MGGLGSGGDHLGGGKLIVEIEIDFGEDGLGGGEGNDGGVGGQLSDDRFFNDGGSLGAGLPTGLEVLEQDGGAGGNGENGDDG